MHLLSQVQMRASAGAVLGDTLPAWSMSAGVTSSTLGTVSGIK